MTVCSKRFYVKFEALSKGQDYDATAHISYVLWVPLPPWCCTYTVCLSEEVKRAAYAGKVSRSLSFFEFNDRGS